MSIFDNATSVVIGNKEVQSIVRVSDGAVLYQKPVSHNYTLSWSSASYTATGGSAVISCTLLDNGSPVSGATVSVSGSDGSLYSGITNSSGVATFTVSSNNSGNITYTGSYGNVSASCMVSYSSVDITLSEPLDSIIIHQVTSPDIVDISFLYAQEVADFDSSGPVTVNWLNNHQLTWSDLEIYMNEGLTPDSILNYAQDVSYMDVDVVEYGLDSIPLLIPWDLDNNIYRVEYTATDSTHLTITITNDIISE